MAGEAWTLGFYSRDRPDAAPVTVKATLGRHDVVGDGMSGRQSGVSGETCRSRARPAGVYHPILMEGIVVVAGLWGCGELVSASCPHIHSRGRGISFACGWLERLTRGRLTPTGVWLMGSVARGCGLTHSEMPPPSPASSEGSNGMVPIACDCGSVGRRDPKDDPRGLNFTRSLPC